MLQHVGADDGVVLFAGKGGAQIAGLKVVYHHAAVVRTGVVCLGLAQGYTVTDSAAGELQVLAQCPAATAQVQHARSLGHQVGQHRERSAFARLNGAQVDVQVVNGLRHPRDYRWRFCGHVARRLRR